jgi:hypothetical protein
MAFVHYRSPDVRPGHLGESLRTKRVVDAWARIRRFLAECTDDPPPRSVILRVERAVDDDGSAAVIAAEIDSEFGGGTEWRSNSGEELVREWAVDAALLERVVGTCARYEARPRIHVNPAVRRHGSPRTPQVWATIAYEFELRCGVEDVHPYRPGWGQSTLRAYLGFNEIGLVLHLPFSGMSPELERSVMAIEAALGHSLSRKRLRVHAR